MTQVTIHDAKTHLSDLVERAAKGEYFVIAKSGKPMVKVIPYNQPTAPPSRVGFMQGEITVPDDFDEMGNEEIIISFEGNI